MTEETQLQSIERRQRSLMVLAAAALIIALAALVLTAYAVQQAGQPHAPSERPAVTQGAQ